MPKGLILVNAYYHTPEIGYQPARMQEELAKRGVPADIPADGRLPRPCRRGQAPCGVQRVRFLRVPR